MKDEEMLNELRNAARRADDAAAQEPPLGPAFEDEVAARVLALGKSAPAPAPAPLPVASIAAARPARRFRAYTPLVTGLALAAAVALAVTRPWGTAEPLPEYALLATGGDETQRAIDPVAGVTTAHPDSVLSVTLRPSLDVSGPLAVSVVTVRGDRATTPRAAIRLSPTGSVAVEGPARDLVGAAPGDAVLVVVVARQGLAVDPRAIALGAAPPRGAYAGRLAVHVVP